MIDEDEIHIKDLDTMGALLDEMGKVLKSVDKAKKAFELSAHTTEVRKYLCSVFWGASGDLHKSPNGLLGGGTPCSPKPSKSVFRIPNVRSDGPVKDSALYCDKAGKEHNTRIDVVIDRPVSQQMEDAINRLYKGEEIPMKEIENIPEIRREEELAKAITIFHKFTHPEEYEDKAAKIDEIYKRLSFDVVTFSSNNALKRDGRYGVKKGKELWLVTGLPGSGKSTMFVGPLSKKHCARIVDSEAIKKLMPGYCNGFGAPDVHAQLKAINDSVFVESLDRGDNIIYPVLGYNPAYVGDLIQFSRRKGYKVHLILNELPFSQSLARCLERRLKTGRNIPLAIFKKIGDRPSEAYEILKKQVDTYEKHTGDGVSTKLVEKGENRDLPPVKREPVYSYHGKPIGEFVSYESDGNGNIRDLGGTLAEYEMKKKPFADTFMVKPRRPKYLPASWFDSLTKLCKDTGRDSENDFVGDFLKFDIQDIPDAFEDEIEGAETAADLARFHYVASGAAADC